MGKDTIDISEMVNSFKDTIAKQAEEIAILRGRVAYLLSEIDKENEAE